MKKYISLTDIEKAIKLLDSYKEEHHPDGELYYALAIATHIMKNDFFEVVEDMLFAGQEDKFDS